MSNSFYIYPKDSTTEFLEPVRKALIEFKGVNGVYGDSTDDDFYETMSTEIERPSFDSLFFLGHGSTTQLYGSRFSILLLKEDLEYLNNKALIIFACNSSQLLMKIKAKRGIGFGFIPSGLDDAANSPKFHDLDISTLESNDWEYIRNVYQKCWVRSIKSIGCLSDVYQLYKMLNLFFNKAIVDILLDSALRNRKLIADILYYVKREMKVFI